MPRENEKNTMGSESPGDWEKNKEGVLELKKDIAEKQKRELGITRAKTEETKNPEEIEALKNQLRKSLKSFYEASISELKRRGNNKKIEVRNKGYRDALEELEETRDLNELNRFKEHVIIMAEKVGIPIEIKRERDKLNELYINEKDEAEEVFSLGREAIELIGKAKRDLNKTTFGKLRKEVEESFEGSPKTQEELEKFKKIFKKYYKD